MIHYKDRTFCIAPACVNKCGRKLTDEIDKAASKAGLPCSCAHFCDDNGEPINRGKEKA